MAAGEVVDHRDRDALRLERADDVGADVAGAAGHQPGHGSSSRRARGRPNVPGACQGGRVKVLVVHNEYRAALPSGENLVVRRQIDDLRAIGVDVIPYLRSSDELARAGRSGRMRAAASAVGFSDAIGDLRRVLKRERPDVVHLHNLFPLISARVVGLAQTTAPRSSRPSTTSGTSASRARTSATGTSASTAAAMRSVARASSTPAIAARRPRAWSWRPRSPPTAGSCAVPTP